MASIPQAIGEMVPDSILNVIEAASLHKESRHAGTTETVPLSGGGGAVLDR